MPLQVRLVLEVAYNKVPSEWVIVQSIPGRESTHIRRWRAPAGIPSEDVLADIQAAVADAVGLAIVMSGVQLQFLPLGGEGGAAARPS